MRLINEHYDRDSIIYKEDFVYEYENKMKHNECEKPLTIINLYIQEHSIYWFLFFLIFWWQYAHHFFPFNKISIFLIQKKNHFSRFHWMKFFIKIFETEGIHFKTNMVTAQQRSNFKIEEDCNDNKMKSAVKTNNLTVILIFLQ